jgi:hypothetical protein
VIVFKIDGVRYSIQTDAQSWNLRKWEVSPKTQQGSWGSPIGYYLRLEQLSDKLAKMGCAGVIDRELKAIQEIREALRELLGDHPPRPGYDDL